MNYAVVLVVLRESLEALLILGVLTAVVQKSRQLRAGIWVAGGALSGALAALSAGFLFYRLPDLISDEALTWFEILAPLMAALMIFQVIWAMRERTRLAGKQLHGRATESLNQGDLIGLGVASFLATGREGFETVLFLGGEILAAHGGALTKLLVSVGIGFAVAIACYWIFQNGLKRVGMSWFFRVTTVMLLMTAGYLLVDSFHRAKAQGLF